ncbi:MAG: hypothetical protein FWG79_08440 [Bacteroidales bacterium]|nr:hypothetical protein [Bacteroidales bacterium]
MKRPQIKIPLTKLDYALELVSLLSVLGTILLFIVFWSNHEDKAVCIFLLIISIFTYLGMTALSRLPHILNFPVNVSEENAFILCKLAIRMLRWTKLFVCLMFADIIWQIAVYKHNLISISLYFFLGGMAICFIYYILKMTKITNSQQYHRHTNH